MDRNTDTFLKIIDREKDEVFISKWVVFLLNPNNTTPKIIEKLLEETQANTDVVDFVELFKDSKNQLRYIHTEENTSGNGFVDILIQFNLFEIIIENKVNALETSNQSIRYEQFGNEQNIPVKYILLKPDYNLCQLQNEHFVTIYYKDFSEILKSISKSELKYEENYIYLQEFIRHSELYLTGITTDKKSIFKSKKNKKKLVDKIKKVFGIPDDGIYETHDIPKYNCVQVWKRGWNTQKEIANHKGIHYEIVFLKDFDTLCEKDIRVYFEIHNESINKRIPKEVLPKKQSLFTKKYDFDTEKNVEHSIDEMAYKLKEIAEENDVIIEEKIRDYLV